MRINIITETQSRNYAKDEFKKFQKPFWNELEKLRKRIVKLEMQKTDAMKPLKAVRKNEK